MSRKTNQQIIAVIVLLLIIVAALFSLGSKVASKYHLIAEFNVSAISIFMLSIFLLLINAKK